MKQIDIFERAGAFAENKDIAKEIRIKEIIPVLNGHEEIILNFKQVEAATQSFIHALISGVIRQFGSEALSRISFKSCNEDIKKIINIVADYMQD